MMFGVDELYPMGEGDMCAYLRVGNERAEGCVCWGVFWAVGRERVGFGVRVVGRGVRGLRSGGLSLGLDGGEEIVCGRGRI